jgi:hypothetical protein
MPGTKCRISRFDSEGAAGNMINRLVHPRQMGPFGTDGR